MEISNELLQRLSPSVYQVKNWCRVSGLNFIRVDTSEMVDKTLWAVAYSTTCQSKYTYLDASHVDWKRSSLHILLQPMWLSQCIKFLYHGAVVIDIDGDIFRMKDGIIEVYQDEWMEADVFRLRAAIDNIYYFAPWIDYETACIDRELQDSLKHLVNDLDSFTVH